MSPPGEALREKGRVQKERQRIGAKTTQVSSKIQIPKERKFPNKQREKERKEKKTNKRIEEKQQLEPLKTEQQIKLSNRGYR